MPSHLRAVLVIVRMVCGVALLNEVDAASGGKNRSRSRSTVRRVSCNRMARSSGASAERRAPYPASSIDLPAP